MAYTYPTSLRDTRIGVETTPGTPVAAGILLPGISITPKPVVETITIPRAGRAFKRAIRAVKEYTEAKAEGTPDFNALVYFLASYLGAPTTTDVGAAGNAYQHDFALVTGGEVGKTLTVEHTPAGTGEAFRFAYGVVKAMELTFSRSEGDTSASFSADLFGMALQRGITPSAATELTFAPILPTLVSLYVADTPAGLDTATPWEPAFQATLSFGERYRPEWHIRADQADFAGVIPKSEQEISITLKTAVDGNGLAWLDLLRAGGRKYVRVEAVGEEIETGQNYRLRLDFPVEVAEVGDFSDEDGLYAAEFTLQAVDDDALGAVCKGSLVNVVASV